MWFMYGRGVRVCTVDVVYWFLKSDYSLQIIGIWFKSTLEGEGSVFCVCISLMTAETLIGSFLVADFVVHIICSAFLSYIILYISFHYHNYDIFYCNNSHLLFNSASFNTTDTLKSLYSIEEVTSI